MSPTRVDVIMPVRCARETLPDALDDGLGQVGVEVRVLAVVDVPASGDDGSAKWLAERARGDERLTVLEGAGRGVGAALDIGLGAASTTWIAHMEADDRCQPDRLRRQLDALAVDGESAPPAAAAPAVSAALAAPLAAVTCRVTQSGARTPGMARYLAWQNGLLTHDEMARERWIEIPALHQTGVYRAEAVRACGGYAPRGEWPADIDFWFRWFEPAARGAATRRTGKLPRVLYHWRQHGAQSTRKSPLHSLEALREAKAHYLARAVGPRGATPRPVHLVSIGRTLAAWSGALRRAGVEVLGRTAWRPVDPLPRGVLRSADGGALVLAAYGRETARRHVRERLAESALALREPEGLLFTA
jgi:hypothetical protein